MNRQSYEESRAFKRSIKPSNLLVKEIKEDLKLHIYQLIKNHENKELEAFTYIKNIMIVDTMKQRDAYLLSGNDLGYYYCECRYSALLELKFIDIKLKDKIENENMGESI